MEFLNIIGMVAIKPDWANISGAVLKAGTPLSITGVVANNANAIGLLADEAHKGDGEVNVVYAGLVDINEVEASYGDSLADDCKAALKGITIVDTSGSPIVPSGGGGGVTTLYYDTSYIYETNNFWTDRAMTDYVTFADAAAMVAANPAAVVFAEVGDTYLPAHAISDGTYGISFVALMAQGGGYAVATISSDYGYSSIVPHTFNEGAGGYEGGGGVEVGEP